MKKYFKWEYLIVFLLFLSYNIYSSNSKIPANDSIGLKTSFKEFLKKENISMDIKIVNKYETIQPLNLYTNNYFGVTIDFPDIWEANRGVAEHSLYNVFSSDSAISMGINAIPAMTEQSSESIYDIKTINSKIKGGDFKSTLMNSITANTNRKIQDFRMVDKKIREINYIYYICRYTDSFDGVEVPMISEVYQTMCFGTAFSIYYYTPEVFYNKNRFDDVLASTNFINPKLYE